jgi:hypothetical protein
MATMAGSVIASDTFLFNRSGRYRSINNAGLPRSYKGNYEMVEFPGNTREYSMFFYSERAHQKGKDQVQRPHRVQSGDHQKRYDFNTGPTCSKLHSCLRWDDELTISSVRKCKSTGNLLSTHAFCRCARHACPFTCYQRLARNYDLFWLLSPEDRGTGDGNYSCGNHRLVFSRFTACRHSDVVRHNLHALEAARFSSAIDLCWFRVFSNAAASAYNGRSLPSRYGGSAPGVYCISRLWVWLHRTSFIQLIWPFFINKRLKLSIVDTAVNNTDQFCRFKRLIEASFKKRLFTNISLGRCNYKGSRYDGPRSRAARRGSDDERGQKKWDGPSECGISYDPESLAEDFRGHFFINRNTALHWRRVREK